MSSRIISQLCVASTSALPHTTSRLLHTSLPLYAVEKKLSGFKAFKAIKKKIAAKKLAKFTEYNESRPDYARGYMPGREDLWLNCRLKRILLEPEVLWDMGAEQVSEQQEKLKDILRRSGEGKFLDAPVGDEKLENAAPSDAAEEKSEQSESKAEDNTEVASYSSASEIVDVKPLEDSEGYIPQSRFVNRLGSSPQEFLFKQLPQLSASNSLAADGSIRELVSQLEIEKSKALQLAKVLDLNNASRLEIRKYNKKLITEEFGKVIPGVKDSGGPGCFEVQSALATYRLHMLAERADSSHKSDKVGRLALHQGINARKQLFKKFKKHNVERYYATLAELGIDPRAVEGDLDLRRFKRGIPRSATKWQ